MTTAVQRRRGTSTEHSTFTGLDGEITVNTTTYTLHIHDGATVGGVALAKADGSNIVTSSIDINGGTIDGTVIGGSSAAAGSFTTISASGEIAANGGVALPDSGQATFGAGDDLKIYHTGSHSYIDENGTGNLYIGSNNGGGVYIQGSGENLASFIDDGAVTLYYDNASKLATTATGIDVTGTVTADGLNIGTPNDLNSAQVSVAAADNAFIEVESKTTQLTAGFMWTNSGTRKWTLEKTGTNHDLFLQNSADTTSVQFHQNNDISFYEDTGTTAKFFWDASAESLGIGQGVFSGTQALNLKGEGIAIKNDKSGSNNNWSLIRNTATASESNISFVSGAGEAMVIDHGGNVGIGTSSPTTNLDGLKGLSIDGGTTGGGVAVGSSTHAYLMYTNAAVSDGLVFWDSTNNAERMRIDSTGNLRVGVGNTFEPVMQFTNSGRVEGNPGFTFSGDLDTGMFNPSTQGTIAFSNNGSESMRLDSSGNLLVGVTSISDTSSRTFGNAFAGSGANGNWTSWGSGSHTHANFRNGTGIVGTITSTSSATAYNTSSDYRLKENVVSMDNASDRVLALNPVRFNFIADPDKTVDGFLAHEAQAVVPEAVTGSKDAMTTEEYEVSPAVLDEDGNVVTEAVMGTREVPDYQGIDQSKLVPLLTKALQEALERIAVLESKVGA